MAVQKKYRSKRMNFVAISSTLWPLIQKFEGTINDIKYTQFNI